MQKIKYLTLALFALLLTACHRDKAPEAAPLYAFNPTLPVQTVWSNSIGSNDRKAYLKLTPVLLGNQIYANSYDGQVRAMDAQTGRALWAVNVKHKLTTGLSGDENYVFTGTKDGEVLSISRDSGHIVWHTPLANEVLARPNGSGPLVIAKSADDHVYGLKKYDGQVQWNYKETTPDLALRGGGNIQVADGIAIIGFADGQVGAFSVKDGQMLWKQSIGAPQGVTIVDEVNDVNDSLLISNGTIFAAAYQGAIAALTLHSGQSLWSHDVSAYSGIAADGRAVYVADAKGHVLAFNRRSGEVLWEQSKLFGRGLTGPAVAGNALIVGDSKGYIHWLSTSDGHFLARAQIDKSGILATPIVNDNAVYVYSNAGRLVKYRF